MKNTVLENESAVVSGDQKTKRSYQKPALKEFGDITDLVQGSFGAGTDGGAVPFQAS